MMNMNRYWKIALAVVGALLLAALLGPALIWWFRAAVFGHLVSEITNLTRWNDRFVKAALLTLGLPFFWALGHVLRPGLPALTRAQGKAKARRRGIAFACLFGYAALFYLATGFATRELYFDRRGRPMKYCVERPSGLYCEDRPGFDPNGVRLVPVTREMADRQEQRKRGQVPRRVIFANCAEFDAGQFFGPDGGARIWFGRALGGEIELFDRPGYHPVTGRPLEAISVDLLRNLRTQLAAREREEAERLRIEAELQAELERQRTEAEQRERLQDATASWPTLSKQEGTPPVTPPGPSPFHAVATIHPGGTGCLVLRSELPEPITVEVEQANRELVAVHVPAGATVRLEGPFDASTRVRAPGNPRQGWRKDLEVSIAIPPGDTTELLLRRPLRRGDPIRLFRSSPPAAS